MCGRFTLATTLEALRAAFPDFVMPDTWTPRYNIAPSQPIPVVPNDGQEKVEFFRWGLIPHWAGDPKIGNRMINARAETVAEKPSFRDAFRQRRCLILADGFYEWRKQPGRKTKTPMYLQLKSSEPFAFAGLWERWQAPGADPIQSCTIITTTPNDLVKDIHNRMPVILDPQAYALWLDLSQGHPERLNAWLKPYPASQMTAYAVSTVVNNPRNDSPACIQPVD